MIESVSQAFNRRFSGFNMRSYLMLLSTLTVLSAYASDYQRKLTWSETNQTFAILDGKSVSQPTFTNAAHREKFGMLPYYNETFPINAAGTITVQVLNAVYSAAGHLDDASLKNVTENITPQADLSFYRKRPQASVSILPFRKNASTGAIEKLESFVLRVTVVPKAQQRSANSYATHSVLANGSWYKISVNAAGMYKIDYNFIKTTLGIDPSSFNLNTLAIFGNGGGMLNDVAGARADDLTENATMLVDNNGNNKFDQGDYLLFYGQMPDAWFLNPTTKLFYHQKNLYSDNTYYFLTTTSGTGKRVQSASADVNPNKTITDFDEHAYHDSDQYSLLQSGREWVGDKMTSYANTMGFSFNFPNLITTTPVTMVSSVAVNAAYSSHTIASINGQTVVNHFDPGLPGGSYPPAADAYTALGTYNAGSGSLNVGYSFNVPSDPSGSAASYIDWFELNFKRSLSLSGDAMSFRNISSIGTGNLSQFILGNANSNTQVWDVTNLNAIQKMAATLNGSSLSFNSHTDQLNEYIAFNQGAGFANPKFVAAVPNQDLHSSAQSALVIVTYDDFADASNTLAAFHRSNDNITTNVAKLSEIYNEFGSGKADISAIRDYMKMLYDRAGSDTTKMPRYLCLMGDGSFDPKGRVPNSSNFVPAYESYDSYGQITSYTSDDFYGLLDDGEGGAIESGSQQLDIGVGRLPVASETEAADMVTKIKNYKVTVAPVCTTCVQVATNNSWRNIVCFVADYLFNGGDIFEQGSDQLAETTRALYPVYNYDKIYVDAFKQVTTPAGDRYPDVNTAILNRINTGALIINWVGHGGESNWSNARIFNDADIIQLTNQYYPFFITATCDFSRYDLPDRTAGESLVVNGKGGAIGSLTTVRLVYEDANAALNAAVFNYIFASYHGRYPTVGEVAMECKNNAHTDYTNTRKFALLADPAMTLDYPHYKIATTFVNNKPVALPHDTLKALTQVTIKGELRDDNNNKLTSFSGTIYPLVYDKITPFSTLGNYLPITHTYKEYKSLLFKGKASVVNGDFSFTFIVPKDINYQYGPGRISYYADNGSNLDANGFSNDITIGGSSDTARLHTTGPKLNLYMNDSKFAFGGTTNASPMLLVELQDAGGINTTGNGLGHDLTAVLDDNNQNKTVLNNYYETALNDFTKGEVKYPYSKLTDGRHTLKVKAWDIYDNSNEAYTEFVVTSNAQLALNHVLNYPNPFTTHTQFMFEHNSPCDDLNVSVQIYSISGKLVKSIVQQVHSIGYRVDNIEWDGLDDYGDPIGKGVYVYKVNVRDSNGQSAHKFEKLVVLR